MIDMIGLEHNLHALGYEVHCFDTGSEAADYLDSVIDQQSVGFAGSMTLDQIGIYDRLIKHNKVYWHHRVGKGMSIDEMRKKASTADIYLSSVNAVSQNGEIVNIDGTCNRVASLFYGHKKVYLVIGMNKIEADYEHALYRAKNIAAPKNAKRLGVDTPCAIKADRCYDCKSPQRICRGLAVLWEKPMSGEYEIILVKEDLGY